MSGSDPHGPNPDPAADTVEGALPADHPHNFEVQKELHRRIRNDPDYDDWEYGTEPLPREAWRDQGGDRPQPPAGPAAGG